MDSNTTDFTASLGTCSHILLHKYPNMRKNRFYIEGYYNTEKQCDDTIYMVSLPIYENNSNVDIPETIRNQAVIDEYLDGLAYFIVAEEQFKELTNDFF